MTIYFDEKKQAYSFEIKNAICSIDEKTWNKYNSDNDSWDIVDGKFIDLTNTDKYKTKIKNQEGQVKQLTIFNELEDLDRKRIRALAEPTLKDSQSGQTWLEFYNNQVKEKREELENL